MVYTHPLSIHLTTKTIDDFGIESYSCNLFNKSLFFSGNSAVYDVLNVHSK